MNGEKRDALQKAVRQNRKKIDEGNDLEEKKNQMELMTFIRPLHQLHKTTDFSKMTIKLKGQKNRTSVGYQITDHNVSEDLH